MSVVGTKWSSATEAKISEAGGAGAAIIRDGNAPVVVKTGEVPGPEALVASQMFAAAYERGDEYTTSAPAARIADGDESAEIGNTLRRVLPPAADAGQQRR
jgi:hypothetical protein